MEKKMVKEKNIIRIVFLSFEGEYLNGLRNGKAKEYYDNGKLKFEGEYLNGKKNGIAKEYHDNGKLEFEGEYFNGRRDNGIEYDYNGKIIHSGKYEYNDNVKLRFEGEY